MVLFIMLYKVAPTFQSVDKTVVFDHSKAIKQYFRVALFIMLNKVVGTF